MYRGYERHFMDIMDPLAVNLENIYEKEFSMEIKTGVNIIRQVFAPSYDWSVLYFKNVKIWEGHDCESEGIRKVTEALSGVLIQYEFTDEDEIDGCTPDSFVHINGIKEI